jgi:hypothetical protein
VIDSLLSLADELERRDAVVAAELVRVEAAQAEVEDVRMQAAAAAAFLASVPAALAGFAADEERAEDDRAAAQAAIEAAEDELVAERARARLADANGRAARAREHQHALEQEGAARRDEAVRLAAGVGVDDLDAVLAWASHRRGELIVEHSGLAREREAVVREASELLGSVTGDAWAATSVQGLRARLSRALP